MLRPIVLSMVSLGIGLAGCSTLTTQAPSPTKTLPSAWTSVEVSPKSATGWLSDFTPSQALRKLVDEALAANHDIAGAIARVDQARARAKISGAALWPQASVSVAGSRSQRLRGSNFDKVTANQFSSNFDLSWEIDLWGRLRDQKQSTLAELRATHADYQAARLSLAANVVSTALNLVEVKEQAKVSRDALKSLQTNLAILDAKLEAGDVDDRTALEITLSRADVLRAEATLAANERQADALKRVLEALLGRYPDATISSLQTFPQVRREVAAGLPSELLLRRPDIVAAEERVIAAAYNVRATWKALLPSATINGGAGTSTTNNFSDLLDPKALVWDLAGRLSQTVFQGGRLKANVELSQAQREEIARRYAETALQAFREVETALAAEGFYRTQEGKLAEAVTQADLAEELALGQYQKGLVDIITVLESQRRAFDAHSNLLRVRNERLQNRLDLYLALGGDFDHRPSSS